MMLFYGENGENHIKMTRNTIKTKEKRGKNTFCFDL